MKNKLHRTRLPNRDPIYRPHRCMKQHSRLHNGGGCFHLFEKFQFIYFKPHLEYSSSMHGVLYSIYLSMSLGNNSAAFSFTKLYFFNSFGVMSEIIPKCKVAM